jgi:hypothetical protein
MNRLECRLIEPIFTEKEIVNSGAQLYDVQLCTMIRAKRLRLALGVPLRIVRNGLTTGDHVQNSYHYKGLAIDLAFCGDGKLPCPVGEIFYLAMASEFRGFGLYCTGGRYSIHCDCRDSFASWIGIPDPSCPNKWKYGSLFLSP